MKEFGILLLIQQNNFEGIVRFESERFNKNISLYSSSIQQGKYIQTII